MERTETKDSKHPVRPKDKYIRLQIIGMSLGLAVPVMGVLAGMYNLDSIMLPMALGMLVVGALFYGIGSDERKKLREQNKGE